YENRPVEIDDSLLTDVARMTGGHYFRATNAQALDEITREIDRLERTPARTHTYTRYTELFRWPLGAAVLALFTELGLLAWRAPLAAPAGRRPIPRADLGHRALGCARCGL